jgi:serine/threonine protein kinase
VAISGGGLTGQWLGDYQLQEVLGIGGTAEVYQARDAVINRDVAVKVLPLALAADPSYVERFRNEAQAVGALNHPNIVPIHHFGEQGPYLYLVMPLMKESLRDRLLRGAPLSVEEAVQIAVQILSGLGAAHAQGVVHRDVKPENILLDENGVAKLTDFGIARRITIQRASGGPTLAGTGLPVGTPQYMAPEQLRGEDLDQRADIYALGSVLYEMLTGLPPHIADTPYEVASLVLTTDAAPPSTRNQEIWPELEQVMLKALSRKRDDRYANATNFAEALQDALLAHEIELIEPASAVKSSYVKFRTSQPPSKAHSDASGGSGNGLASGPSKWPLPLSVRTDGPTATIPSNRPANETVERGDASKKKRTQRRGWVVALTMIFTFGLLVAVAVSTGATRFLPRSDVAATPSATITPVAQPTTTAIITPRATATLTAQQQFDLQAASSFRAITLAKARDASCGAATNTFSAGETVYVNLCTSSRVAPGSVNISIRQVSNLCTLPPDNNGGLTPIASYYCYSTFSIGAGTYDMVISVRINGTPATARVLHFTIGG